MQSSIGEIRRRLLFLLLRAFVIVLFLSFLFFTLIIGYVLTSSSTPIPFPFVSSLEGYYLAKGNWEGAETVFESTNGLHKLNALLLDPDQRILVDRRPNSSDAIGSRYEVEQGDVLIDLNVHDELVGYVVLTAYSFSTRFGFARAI